MHPARNFNILHKSVSKRLSRLRLIASQACLRPQNEFSETNREISFVTIELHTTIANFTRSYFLSCILNPKSKSGTRITCNPGIVSYTDAIDASMKACKNSVWRKSPGINWSRRDEPPWHQSNTLISSCHEISCSYQANILTAFAVPTTVFNGLTIFRNFYAHRNENTVNLVRNLAISYGISAAGHPTQILCSAAYGRPQSMILDWIDDTDIITDLLCQ